jgi:4-amino-4-deoxy-L-arabinose transferase-like glycosyltransferase
MRQTTSATDTRHGRFTVRYLTALCILSMGLSVYFITRGWNNPLLDGHPFRQTQTALAAYYFLSEGFRLDYLTPVFGAPWSVPFEFPTYQFVVAALVKVTGMPLDQTGRLVSIGFFYATGVPLFMLLGRLGVERVHRLVIVALLFASPLYLFWARTFLIETTALFFCLMGLWLGWRGIEDHAPWSLLAACAFAVLAALTEITTFGVYLIPTLAVIIVFGLRGRPAARSWVVLAGAGLVALPLAAGMAWTDYTDGIKALNPLAGFARSEALTSWNFGTWQQKTSLEVWDRMGRVQVGIILGSLPAVLLLPAAFWPRKRQTVSVLLLIAFLSGPLLLTNLYYKHQYYFSANALLLLVLLGLAVSTLLESRRLRLVGLLMVPLLLTGMFAKFWTFYMPLHRLTAAADMSYFKALRSLTAEDEVILIYGQDWDSMTAYYTGRKTLMDVGSRPLSDQSIREAIENTGRQRITTMVVCGAKANDVAFIKERTGYFGLVAMPYRYFDLRRLSYGFCSVYARAWP